MKKQALFASIVLVVAVGSVMGQKIETQASNGAAITRVQTALNHLTVIQLSEPVMWVAAGSQAFKVEWRENKVFIEPTEPNASTNLFIWTKSGRLNYELEPAGEVAQMHFAIDQPPIDPPTSKAPAAVADPPGRQSVDESAALLGLGEDQRPTVPRESAEHRAVRHPRDPVGGVEHPRRRLKLVAAAGVAEADDFAFVKRQAVGADRITGDRLGGPGCLEKRLDAAAFVERITQLDFKVSKNFKVGRATISPSLELFNINNSDAIISYVSTNVLSASYEKPNSIMQPRMIGIGVQTRW